MIGILLFILFTVSLAFLIGVASYAFGKAFHELDESQKLIELRNVEMRLKKERTKLWQEVYRVEAEKEGWQFRK